MTRDEIIQLIRLVDINVFCLWEGEKGKSLYGAIKESACEFFIVACSLSIVQHMKYLSLEQVIDTIGQDNRMVICGNRNLIVE